LTVIYTTHRLEERLQTTSHELHLERGRTVKIGEFVSSLEPQSVGAKRPKPEATQARLLTYKVPVWSQEGAVLGVKKLASPNSPSHPVTPISNLEPLIEIESADVYLGEVLGSETASDGMGAATKKRVLEQISWQVFPGEQWAIIGHNGAGKSTLAKLVLGEISPAFGGTVQRFGRQRMAIWERQVRIGLISSDVQIRHRVDAPGHVIVASGLGGSVGWVRDLEPQETERVDELLAALEITDLRDRSGLETSHGQLKKLLIARALVTNPEIVILDEPFDYLDAHSRNLLLELIERESERTQFITVAHRLEDIPRNVTHGLWLESGRVRFAGRLEDLLARAPQFGTREKIKDQREK
jgi:ABC-type molybdenum transport system ATPase subunit/photorepair protein PhrA